MFEYKVIKTDVNQAEEVLNRFAAQGWRVVSTACVSGCAFTVGGTPLIVTLEREARP